MSILNANHNVRSKIMTIYLIYIFYYVIVWVLRVFIKLLKYQKYKIKRLLYYLLYFKCLGIFLFFVLGSEKTMSPWVRVRGVHFGYWFDFGLSVSSLFKIRSCVRINFYIILILFWSRIKLNSIIKLSKY